jgi:glyoxylase-like metal-dependent hydrolase (beta-lactamase superfamily II)
VSVHAISNTGFSRSYIIEGRDALMAVDVGSIGCAKDVERYLVHRLGRDIGDLRYIACTHFHIDHIGGVGHLLKRCRTETRVLFNYMVREYLDGRKKMSLIRNWCVGLTPATLVASRYLRRFSHLGVESLSGIPIPGLRNIIKLPFDREKIDYFGDGVKKRYRFDIPGFEQWEVIETPGHTEDSVCFFNEETKELITGDLIVNISKGGKGDLNKFYWSRNAIKESYKLLKDTISPKIIYPGHGEVIKGDGNILSEVKAF